jgi:hypothetical protein
MIICIEKRLLSSSLLSSLFFSSSLLLLSSPLFSSLLLSSPLFTFVHRYGPSEDGFGERLCDVMVRVDARKDWIEPTGNSNTGNSNTGHSMGGGKGGKGSIPVSSSSSSKRSSSSSTSNSPLTADLADALLAFLFGVEVGHPCAGHYCNAEALGEMLFPYILPALLRPLVHASKTVQSTVINVLAASLGAPGAPGSGGSRGDGTRHMFNDDEHPMCVAHPVLHHPWFSMIMFN